MIITIFNDVVCPPPVQWTVKPPSPHIFLLFYFLSCPPPPFLFLSIFFPINTNYIQLNSRSIAVGSQLPGKT